MSTNDQFHWNETNDEMHWVQEEPDGSMVTIYSYKKEDELEIILGFGLSHRDDIPWIMLKNKLPAHMLAKFSYIDPRLQYN